MNASDNVDGTTGRWLRCVALVAIGAVAAVGACSEDGSQGAPTSSSQTTTAGAGGETTSSVGGGSVGGASIGGASAGGSGGLGPIACEPAPAVERVAASSKKVCQLTGDKDRELSKPTANLTYTNAGLWGTDLGASFEHDGKLWVLFGDSIPTGPNTPNAECGDAIATTTDTVGSDCLDLKLKTDAGGIFRSPVVPGVDLGCYNVPLDGVSTGSSMYVWFSTGKMTESVLTRSDDNAKSFTKVRDFSKQHFINVQAELLDEPLAGLPNSAPKQVLMFGSGEYRKSSVYLAASALGELEDPAGTRFFAGLDVDGCTPTWSSKEADAAALFEHECVGELSVHYDPHLQAWLTLYNCLEPRGILARTAAQPWGPWSESFVVFHPWDDGGYCHFMHTSYSFQNCDKVHDPGNEHIWGGEYGPYVVQRLTQGELGKSLLYFIMSTWNPYNTVLMQVELKRTDMP